MTHAYTEGQLVKQPAIGGSPRLMLEQVSVKVGDIYAEDC
jgi:hypothetical protein